MKSKILLGLAVVGVMTIFNSCAKDYVCVCNENGVEKYRYAISDQYDKGADEQCSDKQTTLGSSFACTVE